jgi:hypothetical protein
MSHMKASCFVFHVVHIDLFNVFVGENHSPYVKEVKHNHTCSMDDSLHEIQNSVSTLDINGYEESSRHQSTFQTPKWSCVSCCVDKYFSLERKCVSNVRIVGNNSYVRNFVRNLSKHTIS